MAIILANTYATGYGFIDEKFTETVCQILKIKLQPLIKPKQIQKFDGKVAKSITHAIYPIPTVDTHTKSLVFLFIIKLGNYAMILGQP